MFYVRFLLDQLLFAQALQSQCEKCKAGKETMRCICLLLIKLLQLAGFVLRKRRTIFMEPESKVSPFCYKVP